MNKKPPTIGGLQADLRAANAEVEGLMDRQRPLQEENERLRSQLETTQWQLAMVRLAVGRSAKS